MTQDQDFALRAAKKRMMCLEQDKARLQAALDRVTEYVRTENDEMYTEIAKRFLGDLGVTTEAWLISHIEAPSVPVGLSK